MMEMNVEILMKKQCVRVESFLYMYIGKTVTEMTKLLEEAQKDKYESLYDAESVCAMFEMPEFLVTSIKELPIDGFFKYNNCRIKKVSENLYDVKVSSKK